MTKALKVLLGLVLAYIVVVGGSGLAIRAMLKGETGERLRAEAQRFLPVEVAISGGTFDLKEWFFLRPALTFQDLRVANPPGYSNAPLLEAAGVAARAELRSLFGDTVEIQSIEILEPRLRVETAESGVTNIEALLDLAQAAPDDGEESSESAPETPTSFVVRSFALLDGEIRHAASAPDKEDFLLVDLNVRAENFAPDSEFDLLVDGDLFETGAAAISFDGKTGPFTPRSSPAAGAVRIDIAPARLPQAFRDQFFGAMLAAPGDGAEASLAADLEGDLLGVVTGAGNLRFEGLALGKPGAQLPLEGEAPVLLTLIDPLADPTFEVVMPDARLRLGSGTWQGGVDLQYDGRKVRGESRGRITGVQINEMLSAFTEQKNVLFGNLEIRDYDVQFSGRDGDEIIESLAGNGRVEISDGRLAIFDVLQTIEKHFTKLLTGESVATGATSFLRLATDFEFRDGRIYTPNLTLENEAARIGGSGSIGMRTLELDYDLSSLISGLLAKTLGARPGEDGIARVAVPLRLSGGVGAPRLKPNFAEMVKKTAVEQATGLLEDLLTKKNGPADGEEGTPTAEEDDRPRLPFDLGGILDRVRKRVEKTDDIEAPKAPTP